VYNCKQKIKKFTLWNILSHGAWFMVDYVYKEKDVSRNSL
jgi:hypothetical protein